MGAQTRSSIRDPDRCLAGANALAPDLMTADERLDEVAQILAAGILRALRKLRGEHRREDSLDFSPDRSGHATARDGERVDDESIAAQVAAR